MLKKKNLIECFLSNEMNVAGSLKNYYLFTSLVYQLFTSCKAPMVPFPSPSNGIERRNRCALTVWHQEPWWEMLLPCDVSYHLLSFEFLFSLFLDNPPHSGRREMRERAFPPHYTGSSFREDKCPAPLAVSSSHIKQGTHCVRNYWLSATDGKLKSSFP